MHTLIFYLQMEVAVVPLCRQTSELSRQYRMMRTSHSLLFLGDEEVLDSPALGDVIPYSLVLLSMFSRGPNELLSPHQVNHLRYHKHLACVDFPSFIYFMSWSLFIALSGQFKLFIYIKCIISTVLMFSRVQTGP